MEILGKLPHVLDNNNNNNHSNSHHRSQDHSLNHKACILASCVSLKGGEGGKLPHRDFGESMGMVGVYQVLTQLSAAEVSRREFVCGKGLQQFEIICKNINQYKCLALEPNPASAGRVQGTSM